MDKPQYSLEEGNGLASLSDVLMFATGSAYIPREGFPFGNIKIKFDHENKDRYPCANTCAGEEVTFPIRDELLDADTAIEFITTVIFEGMGFGFY